MDMAIKISKVETMVVDVGQGQCTFAALYDAKDNIVHTLLFDCGTDKPSPHTRGNIDWIAEQLKSMATPTIDLLVFSHSDNDHISLMSNLLEAYGPTTKPSLQILSIWYAGNRDFYTKRKVKLLNDLSNYCQSFTTPDNNESQYDATQHGWKMPPMWMSADETVQVSMLIGNVIDDEPGIFKQTTFGTTAEKKNAVSLVCALMHDDRSLIICGDATNRTMAWINHSFGTDVFTEALMLTLPHHGSRTTGLKFRWGKPADEDAIKVVKTFVGVAKARTITVSAFARHDHPSIELMNYFIPTTSGTAVVKDKRLTDDSHFAVCNVDVPLKHPALNAVKEAYHTLATKTNVMATYYYGGKAGFSYQFEAGVQTVGDPPTFTAKQAPINQHACWVYTTEAGGDTVSGYDEALDGSEFTTALSLLTATAGAFLTEDDRPSPPHPSLPFPETEAVPAGWVGRAPVPATRALAASSLGRLRTFR
jgi:hypothetical protein